mmetsp:Transcript_30683/g.62416  ORF Transcript_30683/g.62416 Transcript_30683/m.62416 type:complete len:85 (+) Transcript_30683:135-389(+)
MRGDMISHPTSNPFRFQDNIIKGALKMETKNMARPKYGQKARQHVGMERESIMITMCRCAFSVVIQRLLLMHHLLAHEAQLKKQ